MDKSVIDRAFRSVEIITRNIYLQRNERAFTEDDILICKCVVGPRDVSGCNDGCLNRSARYECIRGYCPCGSKCMNQRFQMGSAVQIAVVDCGRKGVGVLSLEKLKANTFIGEYVGEVVSGAELQRRRQIYADRSCWYMMQLARGEVIDATHRGGMLRFMNHCCVPNCRIEKWNIAGEERCGVFTVQDVSAGNELTIDYCFDCSDHAVSITCLCGSVFCRGVIGARQDKHQHGGWSSGQLKRWKQTTLDSFVVPQRVTDQIT
ncbi:hypothetical protein DVH05_027661 [Phytophthora capsici]|nr:hypothetical protein DVH05_027661 [Phytophthora capsici]